MKNFNVMLLNKKLQEAKNAITKQNANLEKTDEIDESLKGYTKEEYIYAYCIYCDRLKDTLKIIEQNYLIATLKITVSNLCPSYEFIVDHYINTNKVMVETVANTKKNIEKYNDKEYTKGIILNVNSIVERYLGDIAELIGVVQKILKQEK